MTYPCQQECCSAGVDVWPDERARILGEGHGCASDFTGPETDEAGDVLYRTALDARGCVFLSVDSRGCRLHPAGVKPSVCHLAPRDAEEIIEMRDLSMLPCHAEWRIAVAAATPPTGSSNVE